MTNNDVIEKNFCTLKALETWMDSYGPECEKSWAVDFDNRCFVGRVKEPKAKEWKLVQETVNEVAGKKFKLVLFEEVDG